MKAKLVSTEKIWDEAEHNSMTDLIFYQNRWFCTFRESDQHQNSINGTIRIIYSDDLKSWKSARSFEIEGVDLRDPKFSITPQGSLLLLMQGVRLENKQYVSWQGMVSFSSDGLIWSPPKLCFAEHEWPWRLTWFENKAYAVSYRYSDPHNRRKPWLVSLCVSEDAIHFKKLCEWDIAYYPSEATIRFLKGTMVVLIRRCGSDLKEWNAPNWIGRSDKPYDKWEWSETHHHLGGPNFLVLDKDKMCAAGRLLLATPYGLVAHTAIAEMTLDDLFPLLILPSGEDCSYPGMVCHQDDLYVSYYSSHEKKTAIYLSKIKLF